MGKKAPSKKGGSPEQAPLPQPLKGESSQSMDSVTSQALFLQFAYFGHIEMVKRYLDEGVPLDAVDQATGMTALHLAVGCNHLELTRLLVEHGASFVPDKQGRMPTTIAAECEVSEELCDFIVEAEAAAEARSGGV
jgi:ankyrin repeat protein